MVSIKAPGMTNSVDSTTYRNVTTGMDGSSVRDTVSLTTWGNSSKSSSRSSAFEGFDCGDCGVCGVCEDLEGEEGSNGSVSDSSLSSLALGLRKSSWSIDIRSLKLSKRDKNFCITTTMVSPDYIRLC